jgi:hypothetical protein
MPVFSPTIITNAISPLQISINDPGNSGVTYSQFQNSLGQYVYLIKGFYVYCTNINQLIGAINYNRFDADGNQDIANIVTTVDPYQDATAIVVDLKQFTTEVILNGNSSLSFDLLPNTTLVLKTYNHRLENSFGQKFRTFSNPFFNNYGNQIEDNIANEIAMDSSGLGKNISVENKELPKDKTTIKITEEQDKLPIFFLAIAAISLGALIKNKK